MARRGRSKDQAADTSRRADGYRQLRHPLPPQALFSDDQIASIHATAVRVLSELGIKVLLPEARALYRAGGALVDEDTLLVRIGPEMVEAALASAPSSVDLRAINPERRHKFENGAMLYMAGAGCPNVTDAVRGRRAGSLEAYQETTKLQQAFDVIHMLGPSAEPQDVPANLRHYETMRTTLTLADKPGFVYARGTGQAVESFELFQLAYGISDQDFADAVWMVTVINTNSPRQIDVPMAQGLIDFPRAGQMCIVTPFCLAGAMAPITVEGALALQQAEVLAGVVLTQLAKPGAPVCYGGFASNVDMKSGAPAFGTPAHIKMSLGTGQLARLVDLPWRGSAGAASNAADMQSAVETMGSFWAAMQANATLTVHAAGWLEGGLSFGYEKFINDVEGLQTYAELAMPTAPDDDAVAWGALSAVEPGGHFFGCDHTKARYRDAFYEPLVADLNNFGTWEASGGKTSTERAVEVWQRTLAEFKSPHNVDEINERISPYIEKAAAKGGQAPLQG